MAELPSLFDLTGRVAVVTGGAGLLGVEFCRTLAAAGAHVVVADIDEQAAAALANSIDARWPVPITTGDIPRSLAIPTDVTAAHSVRQLVQSTLAAFGRLDILVNCAALDPKFDPAHAGDHTNAFEDFPVEAWNQALEINLTGIFLCCQAAVAPMLSQAGGVIVNISSIYGLVGPDQRIYQQNDGERPVRVKPVYYSVTKAGVLGLTRYLATYYAGKKIRVNALTPGGVFNDHDEGFVQAYSARSVLGRMAEKDEMNGALLFLASDASAYMTGANLIVDGGWTAW